MTFIAGLRRDGLTAPWLIDGPINGETFVLYVEKVLCPTLRPGDIVIMDNLGSHRGKAVRAAIRAVGAKLFFLPKHSRDLNPIEMFFAKLKHWLRRAAQRPADDVCAAMSEIFPHLSSEECTNFFGHAGYGGKIGSSRSSLAAATGLSAMLAISTAASAETLRICAERPIPNRRRDRPSAAARIVYIHGTLTGPGALKPNHLRFAGRDTGNKLTATSPDGKVSYEYVLHSPNDLSGKHIASWGTLTGRFARW